MFRSRAAETEWLDQLGGDEALVRRSHTLMRMVNRCFGGTRRVRRFLCRQIPRGRPYDEIRLLDIGSGSCDIPIALSLWARREGLPLRVTCVEKDAGVLAIGRAAVEKAGHPEIRLIREDIFNWRPEETFDFAVGSMFFHHLTNRQILTLIRHLRSFVRRGVFINDLRRHWITYAGGILLTAALDRQVRHDALLSIRRGFVREELVTLLSQIENASVSVENHHFGRITAWIEFLAGGIDANDSVFS